MKRRAAQNSASTIGLSGARILMLLTMTLVIVMPFTEYLWHFDQFLHGGQDFEFGLLSVLTFLCLILVLFQKGKHSVAVLMALGRWFAFVFRQPDPGAPGSLIGLITQLHAIPVPSASLEQYNLPQQI